MNNPAFILLINEIQNAEEINHNRLYRRQLRDASDPMNLPENSFKANFRLSRQLAYDLIVDLAPHLQDGEPNRLFIPKNLKILAALQFYAQGSYQKAVGQDYLTSMSQSSISRCIKQVNMAIENFYHLVKFPSTNEECALEKQGFMAMPNGFPGIIGAIDCTHVGIIAPPIEDPQFPGIVFLNRKGYYSLNVQIICNSTLKILAINSRYPGSVHDAGIWSTSAIRRELIRMYEEGNNNSWLIGDSGYPLEPWLLTPVIGANLNGAERRYNIAHKSVRNVIERLNGVLKGRFRCLTRHRILHYSPPTAARIINSCAVLHNICVARGEVDVDEQILEEDPHFGNDELIIDNNEILNQGTIVRNRIIRLHFME